MRYYSPAVISERTLASDTSRITIEEFQIVVLGAYISQWKDVCSDEMRCCNIIITLHNSYKTHSCKPPVWYAILAKAAERLVQSEGHTRTQYQKLFRLGNRRCNAFLHDPAFVPPPFFGLIYFHVLIKALNDREQPISLLRRAAARRNYPERQTIIRYHKNDERFGGNHQYASFFPLKRSSHKRSAEQSTKPSEGHRRYIIGRQTEPDTDANVTCAGPDACECAVKSADCDVCLCGLNGTRCTSLCHPDMGPCYARDPRLIQECQRGFPGWPEACSDAAPCVGCYNRIRLANTEEEGEEVGLIHPGSLDVIDEYQFRLRRTDERNIHTYGLLLGHGSIAAVLTTKSEVSHDTYNSSVDDSPRATIEEIEETLALSSFDPTTLNLYDCCGHLSGLGLEQTLCSLNALAFASTLYSSMTDSTLSIEVMSRALYGTSWAASLAEDHHMPRDLPADMMWWHKSTKVQHTVFGNDGSLSPVDFNSTPSIGVEECTPNGDNMTLDFGTTFGDQSKEQQDAPAIASYTIEQVETGKKQHEESLERGDDESRSELESRNGVKMKDLSLLWRWSFACIAWFESGEFDIPVSQMTSVMALVNGDSIYVASSLLVDPSVSTHGFPIQRVFGNLGRSNMSLLVPPADPRLAKPELSSWKHVDYAEFDGQLQDCFKSTSLHLNFTDSKDTLYMGNRGLRDRQVVFLEALVSIDDRGRNIGDLDILSMFSKPSFKVLKDCVHSKLDITSLSTKVPLIAVDCWEELLDTLQDTAIFRTKGNWQARLGASAAALRLGKTVIVLPEHTCLGCLSKVDLKPDMVVIT